MSTIRERALAKAAHVHEQLAAVQAGTSIGLGVGGSINQVGNQEFQAWRLNWLLMAAERTEGQVLAQALEALQRFALFRRFRDRVELDMCRTVLGLSSLEELLAQLEVTHAS